MRNTLKLSVIGVAIAAQSGIAMADATIYGKLNLTMQNNNFDYFDRPQKDNWSLDSNASRLGVKGKAKINDDLDAVFKMEFEVFADSGFNSCNGSNNTFCQRSHHQTSKSILIIPFRSFQQQMEMVRLFLLMR